jgi:hypothetical protein
MHIYNPIRINRGGKMGGKKGDKVTTAIYIDKNILKRAQDIGLNVSKVSENALKVAVEALEGTSGTLKKKSNPNLLKSLGLKSSCRRVGGRLSGESLRKLCPSNRLVGP